MNERRIDLHLVIEGDDLRGRANDGRGGERSFTGWLGLIAALDALIAEPAPIATENGSHERTP